MMRASVLRYVYASLLILALLGVVARALVPAGFMPDFSAQAGTPLIICSGTGEKTVYIDDTGNPIDGAGYKAEQPCVFALSFYAVQPVLPVLTIDPVVISVAFNLPQSLHSGWNKESLYPVRGPPVFSV
jgi:hypothetical protein